MSCAYALYALFAWYENVRRTTVVDAQEWSLVVSSFDFRVGLLIKTETVKRGGKDQDDHRFAIQL